jgi:segregation and condensation protein A
VSSDSLTEFAELFSPEEGRPGVVVTLMAVLELIKEQFIELTQSSPFSPLYIKSKT